MSAAQDFEAVGGRTLEVFEGTPRINEWMYSRFADVVRGRVLEVGSGIGNISRILARDATQLVLTDLAPTYLERLRNDFGDRPNVHVTRFELGAPPPSDVAGRQYDTIVAINVIEHVREDARAVADLAALLAPGGHLCAYVPAVPFAYGTVDEALGHFRRYTARSFERLLGQAGLEPGPVRYMNLLGLPGWLLNGRILRRKMLSAAQVRIFERLVPLVRIEDRLRPPIGLGVYARARRPG